MITLRLILRKYNWAVIILYECDCSCVYNVIDYLKSIHASLNYIGTAVNNLLLGNKDTGFTYSNNILHRSLIVISKSSSNNELVNTVTHELYHLVTLIKTTINIDEELTATLLGLLSMNIYNFINNMIIDY